MEQEKTFPPHCEPLRDARLLPVQAPALIIGRNRELAALNAHLKQGGSALLTGTAGLGKTALAAVLATAYSRIQRGGVLWLDVVEDDAPYLMARLGRAYGVDTYPSGAQTRRQAAERLRSILVAEKPLIVLDGRLYLAAVAEVVAECASNVPVVLTNAKRGDGPWQTFVLDSLSLSDSQAVIRLYAGIADPNTHKTDLEALCQLLDGSPLTLELVGRLAAVDRLTPADLRKALDHTTSRQSQQAVLALSFKRLSAPLQGLLLVLATTFTGSATVPFLSLASRVPQQQVVHLMRALVARGLVREATAYGQLVFSVHEVVQRYALTYLRNNKRLEALEQRALSAALEYAMMSSERTHLAAELDNLLGAAAYATAQGDSQALAKLTKALSPLAAYGFRPELDMLSQLASRLHSTEAALAETQTADTTLAETQLEGVTTQPQLDEPPIAETGATPIIQPLWAAVQAAKSAAQDAPQPSGLPEPPLTKTTPPTLPEAELIIIDEDESDQDAPQPSGLPEPPLTKTTPPTLPEAELIIIDEDESDQGDTLPVLPIQRSMPSTAESARGRALLAEAQSLTDPDAKLAQLSRATELLRADEDWLGTAQALEQLGTLYLAQGKPSEAILMFEQAATIFHRYDQLSAERSALAQIGRAYAAQQQPQRAAEYYNRALFLAHEGQDREAEIEALIQLAETHYLMKDFAAAAHHYRRALHLAYQRGDSALQGRLTLALGALLLDDIRTLAQAQQLLEEAASLMPERTEPKRLLKRAKARLGRWQAANLPLIPMRNNREFAAEAYE
ncbi:MAG: hypothetical protein RML95_02080 [Anaerolineae bacterium]|nr:hypothetical protein [Anaerolineae bacterium]MDW8298104.1 hypothetical protein [Anaerolineae bacterium]